MAYEAKIDNILLTNKPAHVQAIEPDPVVYPGPGLGKVVVQPLTPPVVELRWGDRSYWREVVAELTTRRTNRMIHLLSWTNEDETRLRHRNVVIPPIGYGQGLLAAVDSFTLKCEEIRPMPMVCLIDLHAFGVLAVGDGKAKWEATAGGRILKIGNSYIEKLGTGAGQTRVQVSNGATDYLTTEGDFIVATATGYMENAVLSASPTFNRGDTIELDIDAVPDGADSEDVHVHLYVLKFAT